MLPQTWHMGWAVGSTTCREESPGLLGGIGKAGLCWPGWMSQTPSVGSRDTGSVPDPLLCLIPFYLTENCTLCSCQWCFKD